jgi:hypothetical protein
MATSYKVLGQLDPLANTLTDLYTVPGATQALVSSLTVCNRILSTLSWRIAVRPAGAAIANKHWLVYDASVDPSDTITMTIGISLAAGDVVSVLVNPVVGASFSLFGTEIT